MKTFVLLVVLTVAAAETGFYKTSNDHIDVVALVANVPELKAFMDCFTDVGPCTEQTTSYKKMLPEVVEQACKRCSEPQKIKFRQFLEGVKKTLPNDYTVFKQKFDPENKYFDELEKELSKYQ